MNLIDIKRKKVRHIFSLASEIDASSTEMLAHWARYACVATAGFVEVAVRQVFTAYIEGKSSRPVYQYACKNLELLRNPKSSKIREIANCFSKEWGEQISSFLDDDERANAIDSIMTNRHLIAHGKDSNITIRRVEDYFTKSDQVINQLASIVSR